MRSFPRFSVIYSRSSRNLPAGPSTRAPRTGYPNSSRDPPFLVLSRFLCPEWLSPISSFYAYALNFRLPSIPFPERSLPTVSLSSVTSTCLYKTPGRCFSDSRELADVRLLTLSSIARSFSIPIPIRTVAGLFLFLPAPLVLAPCVLMPIRLVLLSWLLTRSVPSLLDSPHTLYVPL